MEEELIVNANGIEIFDNDFEIAIAEACAKFGIDDLVKEGQTRWKAVMHFVGKRVFPDTRVLKDKNTIWLEGNSIPTNNNRYDYNILNILCDYYINLSRQYNKLISTVAFSEFVNIDTRVLEGWKDTEPSTTSFRIWKKLQGNREDSLKDKAVDSGNVMGVFQVGRREYQWDMPGVREEPTNKKALSAAELPKLSVGCGRSDGLPDNLVVNP
uniref:Uncharacterized protein n=1 Tax=Dulem virus 39 TaxID=3145757 RepID=A0AAU8B5L5_9CAUD